MISTVINKKNGGLEKCKKELGAFCHATSDTPGMVFVFLLYFRFPGLLRKLPVYVSGHEKGQYAEPGAGRTLL